MLHEEKKSQNHKSCVLLAAGGTGGHLLPAQMVARDLLEKNLRVVFAAKGLQKSHLLCKKSFEFYEISSRAIPKNPLQWIRFFYHLCLGFVQSLRLLSILQPKVVVGFGSYHTFPILLAALQKKIPLVIFQPDRSLGKVNRFFAKRAQAVALQFPLEKGAVPNEMYVPLLPWRNGEEKVTKKEARRRLLLQENLFTLLVYGGSQGAKAINEAFCAAIELLLQKKMDFQVMHLTGEDRKEEIESFYKKCKIPFYVRVYENHMPLLLQAADLAICRSGAATCGELLSFELPYILIPYPYAGGHQSINARFLSEEVQGGEIIYQEHLSPLFLSQRICENKEQIFFHTKKIQEYKKKREALGCQHLWEIICQTGRISR